ncbi:nucleoid-structuring protein H-NS [Mycobacterium sp.]|uniref:Rv3852 family protein n=1 Tax=Mycobacterium sp. TaxID=1785 RepID=UPI003C7766AE
MSTPPAKAPDKPAKKAPAKKAPAKAAKASKKAAAKKSPAKKAPAKKAAKKAPAKKAEPGAAKLPVQPPTPPHIETNGQLAAAAKDAAAHAKSTVDAARNPVSGEAGLASAGRSPVPLAVAIAISLLVLLLVRQLRQRGASRDD